MNRNQIREKIRENPVYIRAGIAAAVTILCFAGIYLRDNGRKVNVNEEGRPVLERGDIGEDSRESMRVKIGESEEDIDVEISGREYTEEELEEVFEEAGEYLQKTILGENENPDEIRSDLNLPSEIPDMGITVTWDTDHYDVIDTQGNVKGENLTEEGTLVRLTAVLKYGERTASHEFFVRAFPPVLSRSGEVMRDLQNELRESDEKTKTESYLILPETVNGEKLQWEYGRNTRAFGVLIMGLGMACMLIVSSIQRKKEEQKKQNRQMQIDYPHIINRFNLYIRAGMTVRMAWFKIARDYEKKRKEKGQRMAYEEMVRTMHRIQGGASEGESYENYGISCGLPVYKKFGTILSQNLRKGSKGLTELLEREASEAFEDRRNLARKLGEEGGTKLMIPMFLMLIVVFAIVIVPAFFSIQV